MTALNIKDSVTDFNLIGLNGEEYSLLRLLAKYEEICLVFFKVTCPTCIFTLPYVNSLFEYYPEAPIFAISQDNQADSLIFKQKYNLNLPILIDENLKVSEQFKLTNVPTTFEIKANYIIKNIIIGFSKPDYEKININLVNLTRLPKIELFNDKVPVYKPG